MPRKILYSSFSPEPFRLSRSKIDLFLQCPRCFYLDRKLGISRPSMPGFSLNDAVDTLLKKEFDLLRKQGHAHDLMKKYHIDAVPFSHPDLDIWRDNFKGKKYFHEATNFLVAGAIDDIWQNREGKLCIVDYKATSTSKEISLEDEYKQGYKKQMEIYQWIFRMTGFDVSEIGYFLFANAAKTPETFSAKLEFELSIIPYKGDCTWVEPMLFEIKKCLNSGKIPDDAHDCEYCVYVEQAAMPE